MDKIPYGPDPRDTVRLGDALIDQKLITDAGFKKIHRLGGTLAGFRKSSTRIKKFLPISRNRDGHVYS